MPLAKWNKDGTVAILTMTNQENRHNLEFGRAMRKLLEEIEDDTSVTAVILASDDPKSWSQGVDVNWIMAQFAEKNFQNIKDFMYTMNEVFKKLLLFPVPVIAAISGHTFGNGAILACACDFRMMKSDRGYFCFPEVDLGIPFLPSMIKTVQKSVPYYQFNEMTLTGKRYVAHDLILHHVIDKALDNAEELHKQALAFARTFNKKRGIFAEHKKRFHKNIIEAMKEEDLAFIEGLALFVSD